MLGFFKAHVLVMLKHAQTAASEIEVSEPLVCIPSKTINIMLYFRVYFKSLGDVIDAFCHHIKLTIIYLKYYKYNM